jgi:transcriptional regulator with XRE-family HTH domain
VTVHNRAIAYRVKVLRVALEMSQSDLARASKGALTPGTVAKIETGRNQASSVKVRTGLATAFGLPRDVLDSFLDGTIDAEQARRSVGLSAPRASGENLLVAIRYHDGRWSRSAMSAAMGMVFAKEPTPCEWTAALDRIDEALKLAGLDRWGVTP